tara:strand:- start:39 stop:575 length:537 start_codon:yes stop_codon:yes gene_type:complete
MIKKIILWISMFTLLTCEDVNEYELPTYTYSVFVQNPIRIEIRDTVWLTPHIVHGNISSDDVDVEGMKIKWYSDMYWDLIDSTGYLTMIDGELYGKWYDIIEDTTTYRYKMNSRHISIVEDYSIVDENGQFKMLLQPAWPMQGCITCPLPNFRNGSFARVWWEINNVVVDTMEIFLMD